ncbi:MAG: sugar ABC transporter permease [Clostridia bacterium]|nr:sugar ABC transporter permease [Clostridia bacterium]
MLLPVLLFFIIFNYLPMGGVIMAFQNYRIRLGLLHSQWVGLDNFRRFFSSIYFNRLLTNTLTIGFKDILYSFPITIIFALLLNEVRVTAFKRVVQTVTYLPYFISLVVVCGMVMDFTEQGSAISNFIGLFTGKQESLLANPKYFQEVFVISGIWQGLGYGVIVYLSALGSIDESLYEAARIDGANRWQQTWHITLPGLASTCVIMLILKIGSFMSINYQKIILLYNPATYEKADVITSYVYRVSLGEGTDYSYGAAIGLFNSIINLIFVVSANAVSRRFAETSLW